MSLIEGTVSLIVRHSRAHTSLAEGFPQNVRMANLAVIGSRKVNGVAEVRHDLSVATVMCSYMHIAAQ